MEKHNSAVVVMLETAFVWFRVEKERRLSGVNFFSFVLYENEFTKSDFFNYAN